MKKYFIDSSVIIEFQKENNEVVKIAYDYMQKYNMKPNDAIIAASCTYHQIRNLLTMDDDFICVCKNENINLII